MTPDDGVVVTIESLSQTGEGVARTVDGVVLVAGTLPGERVRAAPVRGTRTARLVTVEVPAVARVAPPCGWVARCGGCTWQHAPPDVQRDARLATLRRALPPALRDVPVEYVPAPEAYGYRSRARLAWTTTGAGVALGFRARGARDVVHVPDCAVLVPRLSAALGPLGAALARLAGGGEVALALGAGGAPVASLRPVEVPDVAGFTVPDALVRAGFAGAALWAPGARAACVAGDPRPAVRGADGEVLWLATDGFAQANEALNAALGRRVDALAAAGGATGGTVLELYAGAGNFTVLLARRAARVIAVESDPGAAAALRANLAARAVANVTVVCADAADVVGARRADVVVLDPPRVGAREVCEALARRPPPALVYVSCDPATLGRDLGRMSAGMDPTGLAAFEMFPQTPHLEVVAALRRRRAGAPRPTAG